MAKKTEEDGELCGHINKQHAGINGKLQDLACTLSAGHAGDHQAEYECLRPFDGSFEHAQLKRYNLGSEANPKEYVKVTEIAYWSNAAGVPVTNIHPDPEQLAQLKRTRVEGVDGNAYAESHQSR